MQIVSCYSKNISFSLVGYNHFLFFPLSSPLSGQLLQNAALIAGKNESQKFAGSRVKVSRQPDTLKVFIHIPKKYLVWSTHSW